MSNLKEEMEREFVKQRLAKQLYLAHCKHKNFTPRERIDSWAYEYAEISIDYLGFDEDAITRLSREAS